MMVLANRWWILLVGVVLLAVGLSVGAVSGWDSWGAVLVAGSGGFLEAIWFPSWAMS